MIRKRSGAWRWLTSAMLASIATSARASDQAPAGATSRPADKARLIVEDFKAIKSGTLPPAARDKKIDEIYENLHDALPEMNDPFALADDAAVLLQFRVTRDVNRLEYCGSDPVIEAHLVVPTYLVRLMLWKSHTDAAAKAAAIKARINPANAGTWDRLDVQANRAQYEYHMTAYARALCLPPEKRAVVVDPSLAFLKDLDTPDSTVMPTVHLMLGKLHLAKGEYDAASGFFDAIASKRADIEPAPNAELMFDGRYFAAVAQLGAGRLDEAQRALDALMTWSKGAMPSDAGTQSAIGGGMKLLQYRIDMARAERAGGPERQSWRAAADKVLDELERLRPDMHNVVRETRISHFPAEVPIASVSPTMLDALITRAYELAYQLRGYPAPGSPLLRRGAEAAREVLARPSRAVGITPEMRESALRKLGYILEASGLSAEAADAYLRYPTEYQAAQPESALGCLAGAAAVVADMHRTKPNDPQVTELSRRVVSELREMAVKSSDADVRSEAARWLQQFQSVMK